MVVSSKSLHCHDIPTVGPIRECELDGCNAAGRIGDKLSAIHCGGIVIPTSRTEPSLNNKYCSLVVVPLVMVFVMVLAGLIINGVAGAFIGPRNLHNLKTTGEVINIFFFISSRFLRQQSCFGLSLLLVLLPLVLVSA